MKYLRKWYILLILAFMVECFAGSCRSHSRYHQMLKHRSHSAAYGYKSHYTHKVRRHIQPINKNFIIRNRPTRPSH